MKKAVLLFTLFVGIITISFAQQTYSPYFKVAEFDTDIADVTTKVKEAINTVVSKLLENTIPVKTMTSM